MLYSDDFIYNIILILKNVNTAELLGE